MSRSGYTDDCEHVELYRANVDRTIASKRGQAFLRELASLMDAMPVRELVTEELVNDVGQCCTIGVVCKARGIDVTKIDCTYPREVGDAVGISRIMAAEIAYENDENGCLYGRGRQETPAERWQRMRKWVEKHLKPA